MTCEPELACSTAGDPRVAIDPSNPDRLWVADHGGSGAPGLAVSNDCGASRSSASFPNDSSPEVGLYDVAFGPGTTGGMVVVAGPGGEIFTSTDGQDFTCSELIPRSPTRAAARRLSGSSWNFGGDPRG